MTTYERVTFKPEGARRAQTVILQVTIDRGGLLGGVEVNKEGDEVAGRGFDERVRIISAELVTKRVPLRMDNVYGWLVEA